MPDQPPQLSVCVPTYNRADFLDDCLTQLQALSACPFSYEILISDNGSTDDTPKVIKRHSARDKHIRSVRQPENRGSWSNFANIIHAARGEVFVYVADDDSIIAENLFTHVGRLLSEPDLSVIYTDWMAWNADQGVELHRYFGLSEPVVFAPSDPLGLMNFVLQRRLPPEIAVYRRSELLAAYSVSRRAMPFHLWMYALSRRGRVRFDPLPFYREQRVPRSGLTRTYWGNIELQHQYIGDEMRLSLESLMLLAVQDAGLESLPADQMEVARRSIDGFLHDRTSLEIKRACASGAFIEAVELRRRQVLWNGPGGPDRVRYDVSHLVLPAAALSIAQTFESLSEVKRVRPKGFATAWLAQFLSHWRPRIPVEPANAPEPEPVLVVHRDERSLAADTSGDARDAIVLERLVRLYRVARDPVDLSRL